MIDSMLYQILLADGFLCTVTCPHCILLPLDLGVVQALHSSYSRNTALPFLVLPTPLEIVLLLHSPEIIHFESAMVSHLKSDPSSL